MSTMTLGDSSFDPHIVNRAKQILKDSTPELQVIDEESASKQILMESSPSRASLSLGNSIRERQIKKKLQVMKPEKRIHEFQDRVENSPNGLISSLQPQ
jgi:hypothetical protein